ncbi:MAG: wax ester/triacylglycerol synthase family O-acyltransferase [Steroidobacteraceae bacterium]
MTLAENMSGVDRAWLRMERPTNPMVVMGLLILRGRLRLAGLRQLVSRRFLAFERFRCVPVVNALGGRWVRDKEFKLEDHVLRIALPAPAGKAELEGLVGELASSPLNTGRPLWTFHLIERYQGGSALIVRIHHCYADGIALMHVLGALADDAPAETGGALPLSDADTAAARTDPVPGLVTHSLREFADLLEKGVHYTLHPTEAATATRTALGIAGEVARLGVLLADDPVTRLKHPLTGVKRVAWGEPLALEEVRTVGRVLGCTINDVLVATLAGALGRYLDATGERTAGVTIRATVPVNLRSGSGAPLELGNRFGLAFVALPIGIRHPLQRLYAVHATMQELKGSPQALVTYGLLSLIGTLPDAVEDPAIAWFSAKASLVASNVRGPGRPMHLGGAPISQVLFWVPQAGSIGAGVSMFTYNEEVQFGVIADRRLIPEPDQLVSIIQTEFDRLVYLVLLGGGSLAD